MATSLQYGTASSNSTRSKSRFSKALPVPPPDPPPAASSSTGVRGKASPFPIAQRPLPPQPTSIPRRPVGAASTMSAHSRELSGGSVSSLFSLYKDSPLFAQSPAGATSSLRSLSQTFENKVMSPLPPPPKDDDMREDGPKLPPLPQKDYDVRKVEDIPNTPSRRSISSTNSSPKPKIWRRRSVKTDRSSSISDLKLITSNGFTSNPPAISQSTPPEEQPLSTLPTQPLQPRSVSGGLPGRNIRKPVPTRPIPEENKQAQPEQPDKSEPMGQKLSSISRKKVGASNTNESNINKIAPVTTGARMSPITRLPTPEYQQTDGKPLQPITPQVIPPSPETSPSDSASQVGALFGLTADPNPSGTVDNKPPGPSISRGPSNTSGASYSSYASNASNSSDNSTIKPTTFGIRTSSRPQGDQSSRSQAQAQPLAGQSSGPTASNSAPSEPLPAAFPFNTLTPAAPGTIFIPALLSPIHFNCYHSHRSMRISRNSIYPLACMACERKDTEKRWTCTWCCLRCCEDCLKTLTSVPRRDLKLALENMGRTPLRGVAVR
jgi:hypothetical protein